MLLSFRPPWFGRSNVCSQSKVDSWKSPIVDGLEVEALLMHPLPFSRSWFCCYRYDLRRDDISDAAVVSRWKEGGYHLAWKTRTHTHTHTPQKQGTRREEWLVSIILNVFLLQVYLLVCSVARVIVSVDCTFLKDPSNRNKGDGEGCKTFECYFP